MANAILSKSTFARKGVTKFKPAGPTTFRKAQGKAKAFGPGKGPARMEKLAKEPYRK